MKKGACQASLAALPGSSNKGPHFISLSGNSPPHTVSLSTPWTTWSLAVSLSWFLHPLHAGDPQGLHSSSAFPTIPPPLPPRSPASQAASFLNLQNVLTNVPLQVTVLLLTPAPPLASWHIISPAPSCWYCCSLGASVLPHPHF